ncbi:MAG: Dyp-type peroxidase [Candidatus Nitrosocosmicus sp.]|nr:Dyp-type peroxidase [Candidatus Nitrosocosmicus sp.]
MMNGSIQNGIYYRKDQNIGNSFCIIFIKINKYSKISDIGMRLSHLWSNIQNLRDGIVKNLDISPAKRSAGNLTALIGYSSNIFSLESVKRKKPEHFKTQWDFCEPNPNGGGSILNGSKICYANNVTYNPLKDCHIVLQFIADSEFHTHRALIETWKELYFENERKDSDTNIAITNYYTGFQGANGRSLIGFHDGVSNVKSSDRLQTISIKSGPILEDYWVENGTYLSFMRIIFNLKAWESLDIEKQEIIIGRDKETGCPIIDFDNTGKPLKDRMCPVSGTHDVTDPGNEQFRETSEYVNRYRSSSNFSDVLRNSHISRSNPFNSLMGKNTQTIKVFRQGFQFIEPEAFLTNFNIGLNFICFQDSIEKLATLLTYEDNKLDGVQPAHPQNLINFQDFFSVTSARNFLVPPLIDGEQFPGSSMFIDSNDIPAKN